MNVEDERGAGKRSNDLLVAHLADRDEPCPRCGYNLRALQSPRCPECGDALQLKVGLVEPRLGAYVATISAWCIGLGGAGLFTTVALSAAPRRWWATEPCAWLLLATLGLSAVCLGLVLYHRRRIRARSPRFQSALAVASWVVTLVLFVAVVATFDD